MKSNIISFPTARLAKSKGFPQLKKFALLGYSKKHPNYSSEEENGLVSAPEQSLLQKWLRNQKILVIVAPCDSWDEWNYVILVEDCMAPFCNLVENEAGFTYKTYELALEAGLYEALKLIKHDTPNN